MSNKFKIVVTGGNGRFGKILKKNVDKNYIFPNKRELNILNLKSILKYLKKNKPKYLIHLAGLSRPLNLHEKNFQKSINLNIIGTSNITIACSELNIKLIFFLLLTSILEKKEIIKKQARFFQAIITLGQN